MIQQLQSVWRILNTRTFLIVFMVITASLYATKSDRYFGWTNSESRDGEPILSDGAGYYAYLPQWFIYKTSNFEFLDTIGKTYGSSRFTDNIYVMGSGKPARNKYYTGTAVSLAPFFAVAHMYAKNTDFPDDGYSLPYQCMANVGSIFYMLLGLIGVYFLLRRFRITRFWIVTVLYGIAFGTDISFYCNVQVPFSHPFSFATVAWMLFFAKKWADRHSAKDFILFCAFLGWAAIIRPTNVLALAIVPFLFPATSIFISRIGLMFTRYRKALVVGVLVFGTILFFQLWNTYSQTGKWALNTYSTESFDNITSPKIFQVLFSWRKGLFIFTPILLLMIPGWVVLFKRERRLFWGSLFFFALFTYITASWWCWWYGGGLGMRPYIDVLAILFLPIAFLLQHAKKFFKIAVFAFILLTTWMYQVYEFQMKNNILHYDDMTYEQFSHVFMKEDLRYGWCLHLIYEKLPEERPGKTIAVPFIAKGKEPDPDRYYKLLGDDYLDNPVAVIAADSSNTGKRFGAKITGKVYLYSGDTNPSFGVQYYKNGMLFRENRFFVGQFIDNEETLSPISIEIYPELEYGYFDSVRVQFDEGNTFTGIQGLKLQAMVYR